MSEAPMIIKPASVEEREEQDRLAEMYNRRAYAREFINALLSNPEFDLDMPHKDIVCEALHLADELIRQTK